jgi:hypothetical protein
MGVELGKVWIKETAGRKDAAHSATVMVTSDTQLFPGTKVKFKDNAFTQVSYDHHTSQDYHAIVDPFIPGFVTTGVHFWVIIRPDLVDKLTHNFDLKIKGLKEIEPPEPAYDPTLDDYDDDCLGMVC